MNKLFIVGCGRSGTTMLQQALNRHSQIVIPPETGFFTDVVGRPAWLQRRRIEQIERDLGIELPPDSRRIKTRQKAISVYGEIAQAYTRRLGRGAVAFFGEKSPRHLLAAPLLYDSFPDAKFLLIYRDGRDVALSLAHVPWAPGDLYLNFDWWLRFFRWHQWLVQRPQVDLCSIKYEDFVLEPRRHLARVAEFLDLEYEPAMADGSGNETGVMEREHWKRRAMQPIVASRVGVWRHELTAPQVAALERRGGEALQRLGYELQTNGKATLPVLFRTRLLVKRALWSANRALELVRCEVARGFHRTMRSR